MKSKESHAYRFERGLKYLYSMSTKDYQALWNKQGKQCALSGHGICAGQMCVDHLPGTDIVCGILCRKHNLALGMLGDTPDNIQAALTYKRQGQSYGPVRDRTARSRYLRGGGSVGHGRGRIVNDTDSKY